MEDNKKKFRKEIENRISQYLHSSRTGEDLLNAVNQISLLYHKRKPDNGLITILDDAFSEIAGLSTENMIRKEKLIESSTIKVISEYLLSYLDTIEREIINSSRTKLRLQEKIRKLIRDYLSTGYFNRIIIVTMVDDMIESVYGDEYTLTRFMEETVSSFVKETSLFRKHLLIYQNSIENADLTDLKISYRKALIDRKYQNDFLCDMWKGIEEIIGADGAKLLIQSLSGYKFKKNDFDREILTPLIARIRSGAGERSGDFTEFDEGGIRYFGSAIHTLEDNQVMFQRFMDKLKKFQHPDEAETLNQLLQNGEDLDDEALIIEHFSALSAELLNELYKIIHTRHRETTIGYVFLSDPIENIYNSEGKVNFVVSMVLKSIYKMSEILLINDYEFQEFQKEMLLTLQQISKLRDIETAKHQDRVTIYTKILAGSILEKKDNGQISRILEMNQISSTHDYYTINDEYIRDLLYSASLHDLGKVGIEDDILKNPNRLTDREYEVMKKHTIYGYQRLHSIVRMSRKKSFLVLAAALAENHHERWDGKGYPNGKKGFEIPLSARILAICDVYDALRQKRSYKEPLTHQEAVKIIISEKSVHFDPVLTDIFAEKHQLFNEAFENNTGE